MVVSHLPKPGNHCHLPPFLALAQNREFDILQLHGVQRYPEEKMRVIETSQSATRSTESAEHVSTITPGFRHCITPRCIFFFGAEHLRMQSIFYASESELIKFEDRLLKSLVGNAFEGNCRAAA